MDPITPIGGLPLIPPGGTGPVKRLERITRERDRPRQRQDERERPGTAYQRSARVEEHEDDDGRPHVDVQA